MNVGAVPFVTRSEGFSRPHCFAFADKFSPIRGARANRHAVDLIYVKGDPKVMPRAATMRAACDGSDVEMVAIFSQGFHRCKHLRAELDVASRSSSIRATRSGKSCCLSLIHI